MLDCREDPRLMRTEFLEFGVEQSLIDRSRSFAVHDEESRDVVGLNLQSTRVSQYRLDEARNTERTLSLRSLSTSIRSFLTACSLDRPSWIFSTFRRISSVSAVSF